MGTGVSPKRIAPKGVGKHFCSPSGDEGIRTLDPLLAGQVLSQLSYTPNFGLEQCCFVLGLSGLEPPTSRLSGVRSNRLSYKPLRHAPKERDACTCALSPQAISIGAGPP